MAQLVSLREFARIRGVSLMAVQKAIKSGRISTVLDEKGNKKIDVEAASNDWDANTDQSKRRESPRQDERDGVEIPASASKKPAAPSPASAYQNARAVREEYQARSAKIDFERKIGKLVEADRIKLEAFQAARLTRDTLLNIPNKIAHELAAEMDAGKIHIMLTTAISKALEELVAEGERRMAAREAELSERG